MSGEVRIPAGLEVSALLRQVQNEGGFATVLAKGEADAGTLMVVVSHNGAPPIAYERMPNSEGGRAWQATRKYDPDHPQAFGDYLARRKAQDNDLWIIELDIAAGERFIGLPPPPA